MILIEQSIRYTITVIVAVILGVMFGLLAMVQIPKQLTPTVDRPQITVRTRYPNTDPETIEQEITNPLEEVLRSVEGLREMTSESSEGSSRITLEFDWGSNKDVARLDVSDKIRRVSDLPEQADEPEVIAGSGEESDAIAWLIFRSPRGPAELYQVADDKVKPRLERIKGVTQVRIFGGQEKQMHVYLDAEKLAAAGLTVGDVAAALRRENRNIRAGAIEQDRIRTPSRVVAEFKSPADILESFVAWRGGAPVRVGDLVDNDDPKDVACDVRMAYEPRSVVVRQTSTMGGTAPPLSGPALAMPVYRQTGANVLEVLAGVRAAVKELNEGILVAENAELEIAYDQSIYINDAIGLVQTNVIVGGLLAIGVLLLFLRSGSSTLVISFAIPISLITTFVVLKALGRTLNIISLAGLAFASGMVVDNAIVVLENIYRHRQMGKGRARAALDGTREVWGAIFASTLTTLAVFIPVIFIQQEVGQLFRDIAITISTTVGLSLIVSITVIPMLSSKLLRGAGPQGHKGFRRLIDDLFGLAPLIDRHVRWFARLIRSLLDSWAARLSLTIAIVGATLAAIYILIPKAEYLPNGNQNLVFGVIVTPPGTGLEERERMAKRIETRLFKPYNPDAYPMSDVTCIQGGDKVERLFLVNTPSIAFLGARATDAKEVADLVPTLSAAVAEESFGTFGFPAQRSIFQRGRGAGRKIELRISARRGTIDELYAQAQRVAGSLRGPLAKLVDQYIADGKAKSAATEMIGRARVEPILGGMEFQLLPDRARATKQGLSVASLGDSMNASVEGLLADEFNDRGKKRDLMLLTRSEKRRVDPQEVAETNLFGGKMPINISSVTTAHYALGPTSITHIEQARAFTVTQNIPEQIPLQAAIDAVRSDVIAPLNKQLPPGFSITLGPAADDLAEAERALGGSFLMALVITYLLMSALFQSFFYPFVIMFSVPLAAVGGLIGLHTVNFLLAEGILVGPMVKLDTLAMLGFIILIGIVVNNAILVVHQALNFMRDEGMSPKDAIAESVRTRIRPIFMTTMTSLFGMAPLVIAPGAGSELYRGMGSVILFGLLVSTFFTTLLVPLVFSMGIEIKAAILGLFGAEAKVVTGPGELELGD